MRALFPYIRLVRYNHNYRRLWLSQVIANFGDWFGLLAIYALVMRYSDSELLLGLIIVIKMLSFAFFSPIAGFLSDRFDRRTLMFWCDIGRAIVVLGFLLVQSESLLWLAFVVTSLQMMLAAVFEPAKSASIPNITSGEELIHANVLSNLSWSVIFTLGMAIGGFATELLGTNTVFIINFITYLLSAYFIWKAVIPHVRDQQQIKEMANPFNGVVDGFRFLRKNGEVLRPAIAKGSFEIGLGGMVYALIIISEDVLLMGSIGLGLLYGARGIGTAVGPLLIRGYFSDENKWIMLTGVCMILTGFFYFWIGTATIIWVMLLLVLLAHTSSGANWVMNTILIQKRSPDKYRGRVFSIEWLYLTISESISVMTAALLLQFNIMTISEIIKLYAVIMIVTGIIWLMTVAKREKEAHMAETFAKSAYRVSPDLYK